MTFVERMQAARAAQNNGDSKIFAAINKGIHVTLAVAGDATNKVLDKAAQAAVALDLDKAAAATNEYLDRKADEYEKAHAKK